MRKITRILNIIGCIMLLLYFMGVIKLSLWAVLSPFWISGIYDVVIGLYNELCK